MQPTYPQDQAVTENQATPSRPRPKPGERRVMILQTLAAMLEAPKPEKITTAALAARLDVSEAALYRHFSSKAKMYEGLIEFIEQALFGLVNQIVAKEPNGVLQARTIALTMLNFAAKNPGMTRVLTGEALVGEDERLAERVEQMLERIEASLRQSLRFARLEAGERDAPAATAPAALPADYDPAVRASLVVSYVLGRWHRYAKSGFTKPPTEHADAQLRLILQ
ncbi:nucleoid occlusion factor SlmA [Burkholderia sp. AU19243]|uniref:Dihydroorotate oxidase n=1 Tax=Burkholderia latens TaxID=488446 RepID=A0AAP1C646_9BURK|nr:MULTISPECIES: nucleoid occlusion factor SlmA [Burkholderia]AIO40965.1 bacterial regulatory s, tetR family protein [Burkholderia cenocepacia]MBR8146468.1 nucleoid occlusion factor SlmA [Burkholderia vietnamiensis]AOK05669.1 dihydroorotate oxidase [Burkholderia latens]KVA08419.1 dihydroorotate oxidase [Burkholderia latens]MBR8363373.1 nucleoid occlusion factor SlmA [Burkholderia sp. AU19243]